MSIKNNLLLTIFLICALAKNSLAKPTETGEMSKVVNYDITEKLKSSSLMFGDEELEKIDEALNAFKNNQPLIAINSKDDMSEKKPVEDNIKSYVYLDSIFFNSPKSWSVWVNNQKISSQDNKAENEIYIKSIDHDKVNIVWTMSISKWKILTNKKSDEGAPINKNNQVEFNFFLSFNQTYILNGGKIAEGRISPLLDLTQTSKKISNQN